MVVRVYKSVNDVDKTEWNEIVGRNRIICRHEYLAAIEASKINDCRYFYPVVYDGDRIIGHACLYYISTELDLFCEGAAKRVINGIRKVWKNFMILRSIECGTPVALGNTFSFREGVNKTEVVDAIVESAESIAKKEGVKVLLFRDFHKNELGLFGELQKLRYKKISNLPGFRMSVRWRSFDEYLAALRSEYRNKVRRRIRRFRDKGAVIERIDAFAAEVPILERLWRNVYDNAKEYTREVLKEDFFLSMDQRLGERTRILLARKGDEEIGFMLLLEDDDTLIPWYCGLDYRLNKECATYLNLFYETIKFATEAGYKEIDFGLTTMTPKLEVGASPVALYMFMRHTNSLMNKVVPGLFDMMTPSSVSIERKVFSSGIES